MKDKQEILNGIREGLNAGVIAEDEVRDLLAPTSATTPAKPNPDTDKTTETKPKKLSAVDIMFYVAGVLLYAAVLSFIVQSWDDGGVFAHVLMCAGLGALLWTLAYYLSKSPGQTDIRAGMVSTSLLTGSLLNITGGYIIVNELVGGYREINFIPSAFMFAIVGTIHIGFDRLIKRDLILLMGLLLVVASFPALMFGVLQDMDVPPDVWSIILIGSAIFLALSTRVVATIDVSRQNVRRSFDGFAAFVALLVMYISSFGDYDAFWLVLLIVAVFGFFYLSVLMHSKHLLGNASFFLVLSVITISFRYFSGYDVTTSLILATAGLLGSAALASHIHRKYFKAPVSQGQNSDTNQRADQVQ